jgi:hypothetical protein
MEDSIMTQTAVSPQADTAHVDEPEPVYLVSGDARSVLDAQVAAGQFDPSEVHGPPARRDPELARWVRYWLEMRDECLRHVSEAFDHVLSCIDAGETEGTVAVAMFCAEESAGHGGIYRALCDLIDRYSCEYLVSTECRNGVAIEDLVKVATR